jgi:hypothetical protein
MPSILITSNEPPTDTSEPLENAQISQNINAVLDFYTREDKK